MLSYIKQLKNNRSFTLIELLIVIAILALLMSIIIITLNPSEMLKKSRDTKRISSLKALHNALGIFQATKPTTSMGTANIVYISIPDSDSSCSNLGLPTLPDGYTYACATSANYRKTDGTGWIPVNFDSLDIGSPISSLPIDPTNTTSTNLFFTYTTGNSWELNALLESSDQKLSGDADKTSTDGGDSYSTFEIGTDLSLSPYKDTGLVGYWRFDDYTSGSIINNQTDGLEDSSGYGNNGIATNIDGLNMSFVEGKRGSAVSFDGTDDGINCGSMSQLQDLSTITIAAWIKTSINVQQMVVSKWTSASVSPFYLSTMVNNIRLSLVNSSAVRVNDDRSFVFSNNEWHYIVATYDGVDIKLYADSIFLSPSAPQTGTMLNSDDPVIIGRFYSSTIKFTGLIDDVRIYNRALSAAEIKSLYEGTK